ncbi:Suppressor of tumorigenicity 7 protein-like protein [Chelonia mydas]|uniref:Suppressor of tumorigenicity 7 protein-like n=1 Tax=Chelonia mydas TaxID=8469 RepID=M7C623_CHEMY|nr:Suppressor of tumorigenicity 7 protein-like protein [Chelonia mydas]
MTLIFEWWYFQKYGTSFIEQVSVSHLRPLIGGVENSPPVPGFSDNNGENETNRQSLSECKVWRNPLNLFRGAEYSRYTWVTGKEPLTYYDMNLSAQDHQTFFTCDTDSLRPSDTVMQKAWRERNPQARIKAAYQALELNNDMLNIHENLLEALLELQAYADVQAVLAKYDDISLPKSAAICYTAALLKARAVSDRFSPETASRRGLSTAEINAVEAIHRAVEFNPHVPKYLLEMKSLILPPEHILKRGDSEAVAYAFFHLQHWKRIEGALNLLHCTWEGTFHDVSVYPQKELPFFIHFTAGLCSFSAMLAVLTHQFPELMVIFAKAVSIVSSPGLA